MPEPQDAIAAPTTPDLTGGRPATWDDVIAHYAAKEGIPASLAKAVAMKESSMQPNAVGDGGAALGFFQLHPGAAQDAQIADRSDPLQNIQGGVRYLRQLKDRYNGDVQKMLQAYNGGMKWVDAGTVSPQAQAYAADVMASLSAGMRERAAGAPSAGAPPAAQAAPGAAIPAKAALPSGLKPMASHGASQPVQQAAAAPAAAIPPGTSTLPLRGAQAVYDALHTGPGAALQTLASAFSPYTPEGRQNLAGMAGEAGAIALGPEVKAVGLAARLGRLLVPAAGAGLGGAAEAAAENAMTGSQIDPAQAAVEQTGLNLGGQALLWPIKRIGRGIVGTRVGREAADTIRQQGRALVAKGDAIKASAETAIDDLTTRLASTLAQIKKAAGVTEADIRTTGAGKIAAARAAAPTETAATHNAALQSTLAAIKQRAAADAQAITAAGAQRVTRAQTKSAEALAALDLAAADATTVNQRQLNDLLGQGADPTGAIAAARAVMEGPAKRALDAAGVRVRESTVDGPPIAVGPLQQELRDMLAPVLPPSMYPPQAARQVGFAGPKIAANVADDALRPAAITGSGKRGALTKAEYDKLIDQHLHAAGVPPESTLPDKLKRFLAIDQETVPFAEAHDIKKLLDDTISKAGGFDKRARSQIQAITKGFRGKLRGALAVHEPYNEANAVYQEMVNLQTKGLGQRLARYLATPGGEDAAARMLKDSNPMAAQTLKDLLVGHATAGGDPQLGQQAWNAARASWAHDHLFSGGVDGLGERLAKLETESPRFLQIIGSDETGQQVLANARRLADAVAQGHGWEQQTRQFVKAEGKSAVAGARADTAAALGDLEGRTLAETTAAKADTAAAKQVTAQGRQQAAADIRAAREGMATDVAATRAQRSADLSTARGTAANAEASVRQRMRSALAGVRTSLAEHRDLRQQLSRDQIKLRNSDMVPDAMRAVVFGPRNVFGAAPLLRLLRGPQRDAIVQWAAYSTPNTQRIVRALENPHNPQLTALVIRDISAFLQQHLAEQDAEQKAGRPAVPLPADTPAALGHNSAP